MRGITYLARVRTCGTVDEGIEGQFGPGQSFCSHCSADLREKRQVNGIVQSQCSYSRREGCSVEDTKMFLRCKRKVADPMCLESPWSWNNLAGTKGSRAIEDPDGWVTNKCPRDVRQRREILEHRAMSVRSR
jgi:hypothetical protein